ncbi:MAG: hypothetical protein HYW28_05040 [Rhodospirillales bacterium]|nr:hypothetical protein [Rhodospirillales bacterium]
MNEIRRLEAHELGLDKAGVAPAVAVQASLDSTARRKKKRKVRRTRV